MFIHSVLIYMQQGETQITVHTFVPRNDSDKTADAVIIIFFFYIKFSWYLVIVEFQHPLVQMEL